MRLLIAIPGSTQAWSPLTAGAEIYGRNSERVLRRPDIAEAHASRAGASVVAFYNAIRPHKVLAALVTEIALDTMRESQAGRPSQGQCRHTGDRRQGDGPLLQHEQRRDPCNRKRVRFLNNGAICAGVDLGSPVYRGSKLIGHTIFETRMTFHDAKLAFLSGQNSVPFGYRKVAAE